MCLYADFVWERVFNMISIWFSLFFMTSMLEKSDESYVFSRSDCISHFSLPVVFDISLCIEIWQIFHIFWVAFGYFFVSKWVWKWMVIFTSIFSWFSLFFRTSMLEKSDESYVFSRSDCISHFSPPVLFDISFGVEFW